MSDRIWNIALHGVVWTFDDEAQAMEAAAYARSKGHDVRDPDPDGFNAAHEFIDWLDDHKESEDEPLYIAVPGDEDEPHDHAYNEADRMDRYGDRGQ